ncbi:hypothetical protein M3Y94_00245800 [Aphelenchoides besseyi]|nr:hypothetical protein M3Y94_00245800 [Aphelenchoides besseyi]KAI6236302.1 hypothetical protein M3Y95_00143000 [Aphelenchoides besseyi]
MTSTKMTKTLGMDIYVPQEQLNVVHPNLSWRLTKLPPMNRVFEPQILLSILFYILVFQVLSRLTNTFLWKSAEGFRQYRLRNLTICCLHSTLSGLIVFYFVCTRFKFVINNPVFYNEAWQVQVILMSVAYFIHDSIHMLKYEISRWTIELLVHHVLTTSVLMIAVVVEKFVSFAFCSLMMEVNSIFLHLRTLFLLSGANLSNPTMFTFIKYANLVTFVLFRFISSIIQLIYVYTHSYHYRQFYFVVGYGTGVVFTLINAFLFIRVLAADGFLGDCGRRYTAINRDSDVNKSRTNGKTD